ncbi:Glutamate receptor ionotropic, delta-2 [Portunus trituberculatus]|uniref:Glutamate receptor ionotropic, delta-2 n=1 Tax=Portunus trituberculatus TaxID=210409 RepID=A0A5B7CK37_PORTR|nr:Glutamate receptor ionotropic, delta-2 [Portunus trituberculatus]
MDQMFLFGDGREALRVPVVSWDSTKRDLVILHQPGLGPQDFKGHVLNIITITVHVVGLGKDVVYSGYLVEVILTIAATLNFKIQLSALPPGKDEFGAEMDDGNYSGLIGAIQSQRNSSLEAIGWDTFVLSFHWGTWLAILMLLGIMSTGLWIIVRHQTNEDDHFTKGSNIVFILFSCLVQQGSWILPTTGRVQAVLWLFWVASVVLYASYTAILTSFLTVSTVTPPFTSLEEAVDVPGWKIGLLRGTAVPKIFQRSKKLSYQKVYERLQSDPSLYCESRKEGMDRMITDNKFAFFGDRRAMSYLIRNNCSIKEVQDSVLLLSLSPQMTGSYIKSYVHLGFRKLLPYANIINQELLKLEAGGVMDRIYQQWWGKQVPCEAPSPYTQLDFTLNKSRSNCHSPTAAAVLEVGTLVQSPMPNTLGKCRGITTDLATTMSPPRHFLTPKPRLNFKLPHQQTDDSTKLRDEAFLASLSTPSNKNYLVPPLPTNSSTSCGGSTLAQSPAAPTGK